MSIHAIIYISYFYGRIRIQSWVKSTRIRNPGSNLSDMIGSRVLDVVVANTVHVLYQLRSEIFS